MKKSQNGSTVIILLVIIIVILFIVIGYTYLKPELQNKQQIAQEEQNVPVSVTDPIKDITPDLMTYSGKTLDTKVNFTVGYPSSWIYYKFSCNADGVAFWPKDIAPNFSNGDACSMNSFLDSAPIIIYTMSQPQIELKDKGYQTIFSQMKNSLSY